MEKNIEENIEKPSEIWYDARDLSSQDANLLENVYNGNYSCILIDKNNVQLCESFPPRISIAAACETAKDIAKIEGILQEMGKNISYVFSTSQKCLKAVDDPQMKGVLSTTVNNRAEMDRASKLVDTYDFMIIEFKDETNIPLELILAKSQHSKTTIYKRVFSSQDGAVASMVMEHGSDGVLLCTKSVNEIVSLSNLYEQSRFEVLKLEEAIVTNITHTGMGDRICVDTTSNLTQQEGMIIGSTSRGGILVCSETQHLPYMDLRPFRVNAGGMHSYVWGPDNHVAYLSDLKAGDKVLAVSSNGKARSVTVGRIKMERRPLLCIGASIQDNPVNVFIQDDWHVRVTGSKGEIVNSTNIKPEDKLLGLLATPGRHVGISIDETVVEK